MFNYGIQGNFPQRIPRPPAFLIPLSPPYSFSLSPCKNFGKIYGGAFNKIFFKESRGEIGSSNENRNSEQTNSKK
jgi:hypothetical protein